MTVQDSNLDSNYGTWKNDTQENIATLTIPSGTVFTTASTNLGTVDYTIGEINAGTRSSAWSNLNTTPKPCTVFREGVTANFAVVGAGVLETYSSLQRTSATNLRLVIGIAPSFNGTTTQDLVITFKYSTFISPLDNL